MADIPDPAEAAPPPKRSKIPLILGLVGALALGAGLFFAVYTGRILGPESPDTPRPAALPDIAFVALDPITVSLGPGSRNRHLRFTAQLEVASRHRAEVELLRPRILDVLNGYLRALEPAELEEQAALVRLRAQMLRRIQIVTGEGRVRDLLVAEFVIN